MVLSSKIPKVYNTQKGVLEQDSNLPQLLLIETDIPPAAQSVCTPVGCEDMQAIFDTSAIPSTTTSVILRFPVNRECHGYDWVVTRSFRDGPCSAERLTVARGKVEDTYVSVDLTEDALTMLEQSHVEYEIQFLSS